MNNFPYIDILILAMIAVFIINRLRNVLGKKTGNESDIVEKFTRKKSNFEESEPDTVSTITKKIDKNKSKVKNFHNDKKINNAINEITKLDPSFEMESFNDGARKAFEFILTEYSNNRLNSLDKLTSKSIFNAFKNQINQRENNGESLEITVISVKTPEIKKVTVNDKKFAFIDLLFDSEQVQVTKDKKKNVIDGDTNQILTIKEIWTFSKNLKSEDPNWILEKIEESN